MPAAGSEAELARIKVSEAEAARELAFSRVEATRLTAPAAGRVITRTVEPGQVVQPGRVLFTMTFGALHLDQGADVAVAVGLLGLMWGIIYIKRRSAILPIVNHAGFNALQVFQGLVARSFGG